VKGVSGLTEEKRRDVALFLMGADIPGAGKKQTEINTE
jgi:hypothetical protein